MPFAGWKKKKKKRLMLAVKTCEGENPKAMK
jgi:hypothetical protein